MVNENKKHFAEFNELVNDIIETPMVQSLGECSHHIGISRLQHCINVGYYSFTIAKKLGWRYKETARAGLLHDLFHYECRVKKFGPFKHAALHPKLALRNAKRICDINALEADIILKHMWLANIKFPRYKESYLVSAVDKSCAVYEALFTIFHIIKSRLDYSQTT